MQNLLFVAAGGAIGASMRYGIGLAAARAFGTAFPWGTLIANLAGCFAIGLVGQWLLNLDSQITLRSGGPGGSASEVAAVAAQATTLRHLVVIGILGGLTTFSSFGWDTLRELETGRVGIALLNVGANVLLSLLAVWIGASLLRAAS